MTKSLALKISNVLPIICLLAGSLTAQNPNIVNGYYISTKGDSITGQIHLGKTSGDNFYFRDQEQKKWSVLNAGVVARAGGDNGLVIIPREIRTTQDSEYVFVQKMVGGGYNLYEGKASGLGNIYFIRSNDKETMVRVNKLGYEAQLKSMLAPCSQQVEFQKIRYSSNYLKRYVAEINRCAYPNEQPYRYPEPRGTRFGIGLSGFYYRINPGVGTLSSIYTDYNVINRAGLALALRFDIVPTLAIFTGINYIDKNMHSDSVVERVVFTVDRPGMPPYQAYDYYKYSTELNFKYLELPFGIAYTMLPYRKWSPVFSLGITVQKSVVNQIIKDYGDPVCQPCAHPDPGPSDFYSIQEAPPGRNFDANFFGGVALRRQFGRHHHLEFNLAYYHQKEASTVVTTGRFPSTNTIFMRTNRIQAGLTYYYFFFKKS